MRSQRLRQRGTSLVQPQKTSTQAKRTWGKYFYLSVLAFTLALVLNWAYGKLFFIDGVGFLESETAFVEARTPGRILQINCEVADSVSIGDVLVTIGNPMGAHSLSNTESPGNLSYYNNERKRIDLTSEIRLISKELTRDRRLLENHKKELARARELLNMNATTRPRVVKLEAAVRATEHNISSLGIRYQAATEKLATFQRQYIPDRGDPEENSPLIYGYQAQESLLAPQSGVVVEIYKHRGEVAQVGEPVLKIARTNRNYIKTYFSGAYENAIQEGKEVKLYFENGDQSRGIVDKIYPTTRTQPPEIKKRFGSIHQLMIAEIVPPDDIPFWDRILGTRVEVLVRKEWF